MTFTYLVEHAIQSLWHNPPQTWLDDDSKGMLDRLSDVAQRNDGQAMIDMCGIFSTLMLDHLPYILGAYDLNARIDLVRAVPNSERIFHGYNVITNLNGTNEQLICDMSIAQFFTQPLQILDNKPYFIGPREELKEKISTTHASSLKLLQANFPDIMQSRNIDNPSAGSCNADMQAFLHEAGRHSPSSLLVTCSLFDPWEGGWADQSMIFEQSFSSGPA